MKVTSEHLAVLREAIQPLDTEERREAYRERRFPRADAVQDLDKRYRWDLLWASRGSGPAPQETPVGQILATHAYGDAHLDTALRNIVPPLTQAGT